MVNADLGKTLAEFQGTVSKLNGILAKIEEGEGSLGKLHKDDALYNNLAEASRELDLLLQDFRLNPKRYVNVSVFGKKQKEYTLPADDPAEQENPNEPKKITNGIRAQYFICPGPDRGHWFFCSKCQKLTRTLNWARTSM